MVLPFLAAAAPILGQAALSGGSSLLSGFSQQSAAIAQAKAQMKANRRAFERAAENTQYGMDQAFRQYAQQKQELFKGLLYARGSSAVAKASSAASSAAGRGPGMMSSRSGKSADRFDAVEIEGRVGQANKILENNILNVYGEFVAGQKDLQWKTYEANRQAVSQIPSTGSILTNSLTSAGSAALSGALNKVGADLQAKEQAKSFDSIFSKYFPG